MLQAIVMQHCNVAADMAMSASTHPERASKRTTGKQQQQEDSLIAFPAQSATMTAHTEGVSKPTAVCKQPYWKEEKKMMINIVMHDIWRYGCPSVQKLTWIQQ